MFGVIQTVSALFKLKRVQINSRIFDLNGRLTVIALIICSLILTLHQIVDEQIICQKIESVPGAMLNKYCWLESTYATVNQFSSDEIHVFQHFYKYSSIVMLISAALFYLPRYVWKSLEGGRCSFLVNDLNNPKIDKKEKDAHISLLVEYFRDNMGLHNSYSSKYLFCELWSLLNVILQLGVMLYLLSSEMQKYGLELSLLDAEAMIRALDVIFPKLTGCDFFDYGSSGTVQQRSTRCLLTMNIVNDKIYFFLIYWFIAVAACSTISILYRVLVMMTPQLRRALFLSQASHVAEKYSMVVFKSFKFGDWFLMQLLAINLDPVHYGELLFKLAKKSTD